MTVKQVIWVQILLKSMNLLQIVFSCKFIQIDGNYERIPFLLWKILKTRSPHCVCLYFKNFYWDDLRRFSQMTPFSTAPNNTHIFFGCNNYIVFVNGKIYMQVYVLVCVEMYNSSLDDNIRQINVPACLGLMTGWWVPVSTILMVAGQTDNRSLSHTVGDSHCHIETAESLIL